jgi:hypothetical protein
MTVVWFQAEVKSGDVKENRILFWRASNLDVVTSLERFMAHRTQDIPNVKTGENFTLSPKTTGVRMVCIALELNLFSKDCRVVFSSWNHLRSRFVRPLV